ncbi:MAG: DUF349 domain-containing protein [Candidatus Marinimicrobia bacterium]|nr:DUF349 domain-containing protein [Candidatus Neomarinimicrobiota bacterium]
MNMNEIKEHLTNETPRAEFESDIESYQHQYDKIQKKVITHGANSEALNTVQRLLEQVIVHQSLGDFDSLIHSLKSLETDILQLLDQNLKLKENICQDAEQPVEPDQLPHLENKINDLKSQWAEIGDVPPVSMKKLEKRFHQSLRALESNSSDYHLSILHDNLNQKESICEKAEKISLSSGWKTSGDKLVSLERKWKKIGPVPGDRSEDIWDRFQNAVNLYIKRRNEYFSEMDQNKRQNLILKEKFCEEAEIVSESNDWYEAEDKLTQLEEDWKKVGLVPNEQKDEIWQRFQKAVEHFYARRTQYFEERQEELASNLKLKEDLCEKAEALASTTNWKEAEDHLNHFQSQWKGIGHVPLTDRDEIWRRFRKAIVDFYDTRKIFYKQRDEEWKSLMTLKEKVCVEAESICDSSKFDETEARIKELQMEWKNVGYVPHEMSEKIWVRFQTATNRFFDQRNQYFKHQKIENLARKEDLCRQAESLTDSTEWGKTAERFKELQREWKSIGMVPREKSETIWKRFRQAADSFFDNRNIFFDESDPDWKDRLTQKESLCKKVEKLRYSHRFNTVESQFEEIIKTWESIPPLPAEVNDAVENRFRSSVAIFQKRLSTYREEKEKGFYENLKEKEKLCEEAEAIPMTGNLRVSISTAKTLLEKWKQVGPVPWKDNQAIWDRFKQAVNRVFRVARAEHKTRYLEWKKHLKNTVETREEQLEQLRASIERDEKNLEWANRTGNSNQDEWKLKLIEITQSDKKNEITERLESKRDRLENLEKSILDMKKKLE